MNLFLTASYRFLPDWKEIQKWEEVFDAKVKEGETIRWKPDGHHEIFDSSAVAAFIDGEWTTQLYSEDAFEEGKGCPVIYVRDTSTLAVGVSSRHNSRQCLDPNSWLSEELGYVDWCDHILDAAKHIGDMTKEHFMTLLYRLQWEPSIVWESGIDEGNFEIVEEISHI